MTDSWARVTIARRREGGESLSGFLPGFRQKKTGMDPVELVNNVPDGDGGEG